MKKRHSINVILRVNKMGNTELGYHDCSLNKRQAKSYADRFTREEMDSSNSRRYFVQKIYI
jgi:hypothetical protein